MFKYLRKNHGIKTDIGAFCFIVMWTHIIGFGIGMLLVADLVAWDMFRHFIEVTF